MLKTPTFQNFQYTMDERISINMLRKFKMFIVQGTINFETTTTAKQYTNGLKTWTFDDLAFVSHPAYNRANVFVIQE